MSESEHNIEQYRSTTGVDSKYADIASDGHALKERFGSDEEAKKIEFEAEVIGERVAQWYDDPAAAIREYLSNAETACIRRAKRELENAGHEVPSGVAEMLEAASEKCGYEPVIEVTYNRNAESTRFVIEDNGIGISTDEYLVLKKIGYSTSHMSGERLGQFGMGYMSGFQLTGTEGFFNMRTRSFITEETYSTANYITNFEYLDGLRESYGTRFEFPAFCQKAEGIPIRSKVADFAEGMRVTVLHREMDDSGQEVFNEDYMPHPLAEDYDEDSLVITFENEYFEAVMSPHSPTRRGYKTYNISMPIRRNCDEWGSNPQFNAPWAWDFRGKAENGPIVFSEDESVLGKAPVSDTKYENLPDERKSKFIRRSEVPDDAIVMPVPASSRDSYESGHDDFWRYVSDKLNEQWREEAAKRLDELDDFDAFKNLSTRNKHIVVRGYNKFGPRYGENDPDNIAEHLKEELDIDVPTEVAAKLDKLQESHRIVNRNTSTPQYKRSTHSKVTWKILDQMSSGGTVYMGKTISPKKAEIAWALDDDNIVMRVEPDDETTTECYERLQELWGWELLKELPNSNLKEKLPSLPDDIAEKYETTSSKDMKKSQSSGNRRTSRNPKSKRLKVYGSKRQSRSSYSEMRAETIYEAMDSGKTVSAGWMSAKYILVFYEGDTNRSSAKQKINSSGNVAVVVAPKYVYNYLKEADNVYTDMQEIRDAEAESATIELSGDREVKLVDIPDDELILVNAGSLKERFDGRLDDLKEYFEEETGESFKNMSFVDAHDIQKYGFTKPKGGSIYRFSGFSGPGSRFRDSSGNRVSTNDIIQELVVPKNVDWDHPVMATVNNYGRLKENADDAMKVIEYLREHDALPTTDE